MPRWNPGDFRHRITLYAPAAATAGNLDGRGQLTAAPTIVLADVPAAVEQLAGLELIRAQKLYAEATHRVRFYSSPLLTFTPRNYLTWGAKTLHVGEVIDELGTGEELELLCKSEV